MEIKVRIMIFFFGAITAHHEFILAHFAVCSWDLIECLDTETTPSC